VVAVVVLAFMGGPLGDVIDAIARTIDAAT
jgi:hypothetical protein